MSRKTAAVELNQPMGSPFRQGSMKMALFIVKAITTGHVHDSQERDTLLLDDETALYADAAYSS